MTWQERFEKKFKVMKKVAEDEVDGVFVLAEDQDKVKAFISQVEKEAEERVRKELTSKVNRIEVIDHTQEDRGRVYAYWNEYDKEDKPDPKVTVELQDEGRTLKVFIR